MNFHRTLNWGYLFRFCTIICLLFTNFLLLSGYTGLCGSVGLYRLMHIRLSAATNGMSQQGAPKLNHEEDYYSVLEVDPSVDGKSLKKAYYRLVFKYHPDNKDSPAQKDLCNEQMMVINGAYKVLKDNDLRVQYDRKRRLGLFGSASGLDKHSARRHNRGSTAGRSTEPNGPAKKAADKNDTTSGSGFYTQRGKSNANPSARNAPSGRSTNPQAEKRTDGTNVPSESMADIFADMVRDIAFNQGSNVWKDVNAFLDAQMTGYNGESFDDTGSGESRRGGSAQELAAEVLVLQTACQHLMEHIADLRGSLVVEEALLAGAMEEQTRTKTSTGASLSELEQRLRRQEAIQGLRARIAEAEAQQRRLQMDLDFALASQLRRQFSAQDDADRCVAGSSIPPAQPGQSQQGAASAAEPVVDTGGTSSGSRTAGSSVGAGRDRRGSSSAERSYPAWRLGEESSSFGQGSSSSPSGTKGTKGRGEGKGGGGARGTDRGRQEAVELELQRLKERIRKK